MRLQILIPQFNEPDEIVRLMFDSINIQQAVDLKNDIEILIGNDGSDIKLSKELINNYSFPIRYFQFEHSGVAGTRSKLFAEATADYIMFCDADDMFLSCVALHTIFTYIKDGFDVLVCEFLSEITDNETGRTKFQVMRKDGTFVHGKVYKRQFLIDNNIVWHVDQLVHEDSSYNVLCLNCSKNTKYCPTPLYLWKWRGNSVSRKDPDYLIKSYPYMIRSGELSIKNFLDKGMVKAASINACHILFLTYFTMNMNFWFKSENAEYRYKTEKRFKEFYEKYYDLIQSVSPSEQKNIIQENKMRMFEQGYLFEKITFDDWIKRIKETK